MTRVVQPREAGAATDKGAVHYLRDGAVVHLVFDRPAARNAMTWSMFDQLVDACGRLDAETGVRVAVLRGAGGEAFVAGTDIKQFLAFEGGLDGVRYEQRIDAALDRLERVRIPTVAVVEGYAVGAGLAIASVCDLRVCTPDARFGYPIARTVGNCLSARNYARLVWLLGASRAKRLLFTAGFLPADEGLAAGFVLEVVPRERLVERVTELCEELVERAPITLAVTKEAIRRLTAGVPDTEDLTEWCYGSRDFAEGVRAFTEKRQPEWRGR